ncbi:MAG: T9SS C-terminal target domain-containing protein [Cytophagales bacterium]|nr:MAG: T9SS C-terminal target domain-containing protein [Cytophagales bacterium]
MKKLYTLPLFFISLFLTNISWAQLEENFTSPIVLNQIDLIADTLAPISQENNSIKVIISKDSLQHGFIYNFSELDLSIPNAKASFQFKSTVDMVIQASLIDKDSNIIANAPVQNIYAGSDYQTYYFDLNDTTMRRAFAEAGFKLGNKSKVVSFLFLMSKPFEAAKNDTVSFASLKIGKNVVLPNKITSYVNDFSTNIVSNEWVSERNTQFRNEIAYKLSQSNGKLEINTIKSGFNGLWLYPQNTIMDLSKKSLISLRAKANKDLTITIYLWANTNLYTFTAIDLKIKASDVFKTYYFDFTEKLKLSDIAYIDPSAIKAVLINFSSGASYRGIVTIDEIKIGDAVPELINNVPTITQYPDLTLSNDAGEQKLIIKGISTGDTLGYQKLTVAATSSDETLSILYGFYMTYNDGDSTATLLIEPEPTAEGEVIVDFLVKDGGGTRNGGKDEVKMSFKINVVKPNAVDEANKTKGFEIYPNPVEQVLNVKSQNPIQKISIFNAEGRTIQLPINLGNNFNQIDFSSTEKGVYLIEIEQGNKKYQKKIIK